MKRLAPLLLTVATLLVTSLPSFADDWTWLSGSKVPDALGSYGTKGVPAGTNVPGSRYRASTFGGADGNLWLFGGEGRTASGYGLLNDLWRYDGTDWTWTSGSDKHDSIGVYGTKGTPSSANLPGGRSWGASWTAADGGFWLFGGSGFPSSAPAGYLNDLWRYDGTNWTWVSGSNTSGQYGTYGSKGVAASSNIPGARAAAVTWIDAGGSLWLFGGYGQAASGTGYLNDLWKYDGTDWTWISGGSSADQAGSYIIRGAPNPGNLPGARAAAVAWKDAGGNLWLFGGFGVATDGTGFLNDLWKFDGTAWTWVSGSSQRERPGVYGTKGVAAADNVPGARMGAKSWIDAGGDFWMGGGTGVISTGSGRLNDLWKFDGTYWTWMSGSNTYNAAGVYGSKGTPAPANVPGARYYAAAWYDSTRGGLRLFGGFGSGESGAGILNDLWSYTLDELQPPDLTVLGVSTASVVDAGCRSQDVELGIQNLGGNAGACRAGVYLSSDATITIGDLLLGTASVPALGLAEICTLTVSVTLPTLAGDSVHVGVIADDLGALAESNEGNNTASSVVANLTPRVLSILDVKNDQGRWARLRFARSSRDVAGSATPVTQYEAFRRIDADAAPSRALSAAALLLEGWEFAGAVPAHGETEYSMVVPTLKDSNATGPGHSAFFLRAATATPTLFFDSCPDSGHSVDNLPPALPAPFAGVPTSGGNVLHWGASPESDLAGYRLYRGTDIGFTPGPGNLLAQSTDTSYVDGAGTYVYKLTAMDVNGNESPCALAQVTSLVAVPASESWELTLGPASPNPGSGNRLIIPFTLPAATHARLELVDVSGRRVALREVGSLGAGRHTVNLAEGRRLPAGVYLVRLVQGTQIRVRRVAVLD